MKRKRHASALGMLSSVVAIAVLVSSHPGHACTVVHEAWAPAFTVSTLGSTKVHDLLEWGGKLWIAQGSGRGGTGKALISSYDIGSNTLTTELEVPVDAYTGAPYWRVLRAFNGDLYAGLGNNQDVGGTGDVYAFDGTSWRRVLDTTESDVYALEVYQGKLYAGAGSDGLAAGKLYESSDGTTWRLIQTFPSDHVRSLRAWQGRLYIGLRGKARLRSYDGTRFFDHGTPPGSNAQVKSLVPYGGKLYIGAVAARIFSWNGAAFALELDATATDVEIYKGAVYAGCLYFPTNGRGGGGRVWRFDGSSWSQDYVDTETTAQLQVVEEYAGYLWVGGGKRKGFPLTLRRTWQSVDGDGD